MNLKKVEFKNSRVIQTSILIFVCGGIPSIIPEFNINILIINSLISAAATIAIVFFFVRNREDSKWYFSLHSYVMLNSIAIFFTVPAFRMIENSLIFILGIILIGVVVILPYFFSEKIVRAASKPGKSRLGKIYITYTILFLGFGSAAFMHGLATSNTSGATVSIFAFFAAILLFYIAPTLLIKPKRAAKLINE